MEKHKLSPEQKEVTEQYERFCQHSWDCLPRPGKMQHLNIINNKVLSRLKLAVAIYINFYKDGFIQILFN
ncbi:hypothetical protein AAHB94_31235 [Bacillus toyonensis]